MILIIAQDVYANDVDVLLACAAQYDMCFSLRRIYDPYREHLGAPYMEAAVCTPHDVFNSMFNICSCSICICCMYCYMFLLYVPLSP